MSRILRAVTDEQTLSESNRVRRLVVEAVDAGVELMGRPEVTSRWDEASALAGMTVGALCAHLVRAFGATVAYLDRTDALLRPSGDLLTPVTYFHAAIDSPIHEQIRQVSAGEAAVGPDELVAKAQGVATSLRERLATEPADRLVGALGGRMLTLDDFCRTRLIEVLFHIDDVAASVGLPPPDTSAEGRALVIDIVIGIARMLHGDWEVMRALARNERRGVDVFPVF